MCASYSLELALKAKGFQNPAKIARQAIVNVEINALAFAHVGFNLL